MLFGIGDQGGSCSDGRVVFGGDDDGLRAAFCRRQRIHRRGLDFGTFHIRPVGKLPGLRAGGEGVDGARRRGRGGCEICDSAEFLFLDNGNARGRVFEAEVKIKYFRPVKVDPGVEARVEEDKKDDGERDAGVDFGHGLRTRG